MQGGPGFRPPPTQQAPGTASSPPESGRLLMYINDRDALDSFLDAWQQAANLGDQAFGAVPPPRRTGRGPADTRGRGCTRAPATPAGWNALPGPLWHDAQVMAPTPTLPCQCRAEARSRLFRAARTRAIGGHLRTARSRSYVRSSLRRRAVGAPAHGLKSGCQPAGPLRGAGPRICRWLGTR